MDKKTYIITDEEILKTFRFFPQYFLSLLKDKGAPIKGTFSLQLQEGYEVIEFYNKLLGQYEVTFEKVEI